MFNRNRKPPVNCKWTREAIQKRLRQAGSSFDMPMERQVWQGAGGVYAVVSEVWQADRFYSVVEYLPRENTLKLVSASGEFSTAKRASDLASDHANGRVCV